MEGLHSGFVSQPKMQKSKKFIQFIFERALSLESFLAGEQQSASLMTCGPQSERSFLRQIRKRECALHPRPLRGRAVRHGMRNRAPQVGAPRPFACILHARDLRKCHRKEYNVLQKDKAVARIPLLPSCYLYYLKETKYKR